MYSLNVCDVIIINLMYAFLERQYPVELTLKYVLETTRTHDLFKVANTY